MAKFKEKITNIQNAKFYRGLFLVFVIICVLSIVLSFLYYQSLHATIKEEGEGYLHEISSRVSGNIDLSIDNNFVVLNTMAASLNAVSADAFSDIQPKIKSQQAHSAYQSILLIDSSGNAYSMEDNKGVFLNLDKAVRADILGKKPALSTTQIINNQEYIIFSVPLNNTKINNIDIVALAATYNPSSFDQILALDSFGESAYSQIITTSGSSVTRPTSKNAMKTGYNIFSSIQKSKFDAGNSIDMLQEDIKYNRSGQIGFTQDGIQRYVVYSPISDTDWYLLTFVPVEVINQKSDMLLKSTIFICGLISLVFITFILALLFIFTNNKRKLEKIAYVDEVTGGNTIQKLYELSEDILTTTPFVKHAMIYTNIEKFKVLNEQLGRSNCNLILYYFYEIINADLDDQECMGRISADNFCIFIKYTNQANLVARFSTWYQIAEDYVKTEKMPWGIPVTKFGIYPVESNTIPILQIIDRAKLALREPSQNVDNKLLYSYYDDKVRQELFREKQIEDMMEDALNNGEFEVYLQPKYLLPSESIGGAEALVRWNSKSEGMIFPDEFIPLFEKNGFIIKLDLFVFENVCQRLRYWLDKGVEPVKISVNCSRMHLNDPNFLDPYIKIAETYKIEKALLEIELTESIMLSDTDELTHVIEKIKKAGFGCSMDDFGSGYSSLNLIRTLPVDTLKIDRIFFSGSSTEIARTEAVVKSIITMAKSLSMETVAEGVEEYNQVEILKRSGCNYIQGYVFAKPMKISAFEKLAFGSEIDLEEPCLD